MTIHLLRSDQLLFPPVEDAAPDGLLAMGGDLSVARLLRAYQVGIFPWYSHPPVLWWCPDPRFVLFPQKLRISKSMRQVLKRQQFRITINEAFPAVIEHCSQIKRAGQWGSWITREMIRAYTLLHQKGYAYSVEAWQDGMLAGGLYGVWLGKAFFGESMFSHFSNASKAAFITFVQYLQNEGVRLIDCQVHTAHLASLGAEFIPRAEFQTLLRDALTDVVR